MECFSSSSSTGSSQNQPSISSRGQEAGSFQNQPPQEVKEAWHCCSTRRLGTSSNSFNHLAVSFATCPSKRGQAPSAPLSSGIPGTQAATHIGSWADRRTSPPYTESGNSLVDPCFLHGMAGQQVDGCVQAICKWLARALIYVIIYTH